MSSFDILNSPVHMMHRPLPHQITANHVMHSKIGDD